MRGQDPFGHIYLYCDAGHMSGSVWADPRRPKRKRWAAMPMFRPEHIRRFPTRRAAVDWIRIKEKSS